MARRRGGYKRPSSPAAVSGPGAMSARTDGRVPALPQTGLPYGENQELNAAQSAMPMGTPQQGGGAGGGGRRPQPRGADGIFGPTTRPNEPLTAGVDMGPGAPANPGPVLEDNPDLFLQALAQKYKHPDLIALANRRRR